MHVLLLVAGLATGCAGALAILYGSVRAADALGQALIVAGAVGFTGGLLSIGLGSVSARLRRVADGLDAQPFPRTVTTDADLRANPVLGLAMPVEPPAAVVSPVMTPNDPSSSGLAAVERELSVPTLGPPGAPMVDIADIPLPASATPPSAEAAPAPIPAPPVMAERLEPERLTPGDALEASATAISADIAVSPEVLKSGVIEGMAYTLYADGSVDAELAGKIMHFSSISEWRTYLREHT